MKTEQGSSPIKENSSRINFQPQTYRQPEALNNSIEDNSFEVLNAGKKHGRSGEPTLQQEKAPFAPNDTTEDNYND